MVDDCVGARELEPHNMKTGMFMLTGYMICCNLTEWFSPLLASLWIGDWSHGKHPHWEGGGSTSVCRGPGCPPSV